MLSEAFSGLCVCRNLWSEWNWEENGTNDGSNVEAEVGRRSRCGVEKQNQLSFFWSIDAMRWFQL